MTGAYQPPIANIEFALTHIADLPGLSKLEDFAHADPTTVVELLGEFGRFAHDRLASLDRVGDTVGSRLDRHTGEVITPPGWIDAYHQYVKAGWGSVPFSPEHGGGGFPWLVGIALQEIMTSANMAFALCPMLTQGGVELLTRHGSPEQHELYLGRLVSGEWTATMNLTEPQAGSDVGAVTTRAVPNEDGSWRITGQKIFITYGDHDLTSNIVHLVLARVPGAPPGTKGISCFLVPKYLPAEAGTPGDRNSLRCLSVEHKLGIHASPTCVLEFDQAVGYLIGDANAGMRYMFSMMNNARLAVGIQGLGVAEAAYQQAWRFAMERVQGRSRIGGSDGTIIDHPDIRRTLLTMRCLNEAMRGLLYTNAAALDQARHGETDGNRAEHQELADLLTPISKAWCTETGFEVASMAIQVHGGMGYIEETGIAQRLRDIRIASIYEGTNGIQAADLVTRKLGLRDGGAMEGLLKRIEAIDVELARAGSPVGTIRYNLSAAVKALRRSTTWLLDHHEQDLVERLAGASPYLQQCGIVLGGWIHARQALAAIGGAATDPHLAAKLTTSRFYCEQILPQANSLEPAVIGGSHILYELHPALLSSS